MRSLVDDDRAITLGYLLRTEGRVFNGNVVPLSRRVGHGMTASVAWQQVPTVLRLELNLQNLEGFSQENSSNQLGNMTQDHLYPIGDGT
jgi:hypothetical protein